MSSVYFFRRGKRGPVKIGCTIRVKTRYQEIKSLGPEDLYVLRVIKGDRKLEKLAHRRFSKYRIRGEWFRYHPDMLTWRPQATKVNVELVEFGGDKARIARAVLASVRRK